MTTLRVATRQSALALAQTRMVARALEQRHPGLRVEELRITTEGDRVQDRALRDVGGKGLFVKELELALLDGRADFAVHSLKDLPAHLAAGLCLACVPRRESPYDRLVTRDGSALDALALGARVGTSSLRRSLQLTAARPDLRIELLRGNIDTRLRRLDAGDFDAIVLAEAGLTRLGVTTKGASLAGALVPSIGQGALALECRDDDGATRAVLTSLEDVRSRIEVTAERAVLEALGADCSVPLGAHAVVDFDPAGLPSRVSLEGFFAQMRELQWHARRCTIEGDASALEALGARLAGMLRG